MLNNGASIKTADICNRLLQIHRDFDWRAQKEALFGRRRIDVLGISRGGRQVIAFEIKTSYADFKAEVKQPQKRAAVEVYCTGFYFVCPWGLIHDHDLPDDDCGLIWMKPDGWLDVIRESRRGSRTVIHDQLEQLAAQSFRELSEDSPEELPSWFLPAFRKPIRFDFDIYEAAAGLYPATLAPLELNIDEVPF